MIVCASIDWAATGAMLSGLGSLAAAGAVVFAAKVGRSTFNDWKRQKNEGRRIDLAEELLALAYKLKRALSGIRSPVMLGGETTEMIEKLSENGLIDDQTPDHVRSGLATAQATLSRAGHQRPLFENLLDTMPVAKAIFGEEIEKALETFLVQRAKIVTAAKTYGDFVRRPLPIDEKRMEKAMERREKIETIFWEGGNAEGVDEVADAIAGAIRTMEVRLLPIIRHYA